jgi:hypothetical protein
LPFQFNPALLPPTVVDLDETDKFLANDIFMVELRILEKSKAGSVL